MSRRPSSHSKLQLAAYAGDEAARDALGEDAPDAPDDLWDWTMGLERWGHEALVRACVACARLVLPHWEKVSRDQSPRQALEAAEAWLECPCAKHARAAKVAEDAAKYVGVAFRESQFMPAAWGVADAAHAVVACEADGILATDAVESALEVGIAEEQIRAAISDALLSWTTSSGGLGKTTGKRAAKKRVTTKKTTKKKVVSKKKPARSKKKVAAAPKKPRGRE